MVAGVLTTVACGLLPGMLRYMTLLFSINTHTACMDVSALLTVAMCVVITHSISERSEGVKGYSAL